MKIIRAAYIHPSPHEGVEGSHIPLDAFQNQPAGLIGVLNLIRKAGVVLRGVNLAIERRIDPRFSLENWIADFDAHLILIDLHWYVHTQGALSVADIAKRVSPRSIVILGGLTASAFPREIMEECAAVDLVVAGESERPMELLIRHMLAGREPGPDVPNLWRRSHRGDPIPPQKRWVAADLDDLDHVDISWMDHAHEFEQSDFPYRNRWLLTGRGCSKACFFCGGSRFSMEQLFGRRSVLVRSPVRVASDIVSLAESGVEAVHLTHDLLSLGPRFWKPLFRNVADAGISVGLGNESWGPLPDREFLKSWARIFNLERSYIALSPTSAWSGLRRFASRGSEEERLLDVVKEMARMRFPLHIFFLLNVPGETIATIERTIDLAWAVVSSYPPELLRIEAQTASIDPASPAALGRARGLRFQPPTLADYISVSGGASVPELNWPVSRETVDPGSPVPVPRALPREIFQLGRRCPSLVQRWQELLRISHPETKSGNQERHPSQI